ncbi:MAG: hypothetical protein ACPG5P_02600 [Saprospiraceae bacterium]
MEYRKKKGAGEKSLADFKAEFKEKEQNAGKNPSYENLRNFAAKKRNYFEELQLNLQEDQGYLCVYCQGRISSTENNHRVEHYKPKSIYKGAVNTSDDNKILCEKEEIFREDLRVVYSNLLGACDDKISNKHCDTLKANTELCYIPNPTSDEFETFQSQLKYSENGRIEYKLTDDGIHEKINHEIETVLNLNEEEILKRRKKDWKVVYNRLSSRIGIRHYNEWKNNKNVVLKELKREIKYNSNYIKGSKQFHPFKGFIIYRLNWLLRYLERS